jgi:hypothetical protein
MLSLSDSMNEMSQDTERETIFRRERKRALRTMEEGQEI